MQGNMVVEWMIVVTLHNLPPLGILSQRALKVLYAITECNYNPSTGLGWYWID